MKAIVFTVLALFLAVTIQAKSVLANDIKEGQKEVLFFHNTRRCVTCDAIENETKKVLSENFSDEVKKGEIVLKIYDAEEKANRELVKELGVTGTALIVRDGDEIKNLSSKGFMYAVKQPEKLRKAIIKALEE